MEEEKLEAMFRMTEENNQMLRSMRRSALIGGIIKFVFWILILVVIPYYAWLYIQPTVQKVEETYNTIHQGTDSASESSFAKFFQQFGSGGSK